MHCRVATTAKEVIFALDRNKRGHGLKTLKKDRIYNFFGDIFSGDMEEASKMLIVQKFPNFSKIFYTFLTKHVVWRTPKSRTLTPCHKKSGRIGEKLITDSESA